MTTFDPIPFLVPPLAWPTRSRCLFSHPERYVARTRANPLYGMPGWTRDCGRRFHRGVDIAPVRMEPSGENVTVMYSDCHTGREYPFEEDGWIPVDEVYAVVEGEVVEANPNPEASDLGVYVAIRHRVGDCLFYTLYAHLADLTVTAGQRLRTGTLLGPMGQTSRSEDARRWMAVSPHLHFEVLSETGRAYDPLEFLRKGLALEREQPS
ncbi:MAG: M23 family metallopeptidase [Kiritimatiellae bacterium]|nr:M23 family metallopeptidase [Kiritimatiellia bacterium]MDW8458541.1 M23 family metallopeptidase [Verrucomicrobiota bacterium]